MLRRSSVMLVLLALTACEFPTEPPKWEQLWVVPADSISVGVVTDLLPPEIRLNADNTAFLVDAPGTSVRFELAVICGSACQAIDGLVAPKPEFSDTLTTTSALPGALISATLAGGRFNANMAHDFNFDPLRPSTDPEQERGYIVVRITSAGNIVAEDSIHGNDTAFPEGTTLSPDLAIQPVQVNDTLDIWIAIYSPPGDDATIETTDTFGVTLNTSTIHIAEATVTAEPISIEPVSTPMDFSAIDSTLVERIQSGALTMGIVNPFTVTGSLSVAFEGVTPPVERTLEITQGSSEKRFDFTGEELRAILGTESVDVVASGTVSPVDSTITLRPDQELSMSNIFELVLLVGPTEGP